ncbi:MAG: hypothetical protein P4M00_16865 [Azospirillaceae bacterium]|nr:hypothetical protein [Azospirillaceae bacterium]
MIQLADADTTKSSLGGLNLPDAQSHGNAKFFLAQAQEDPAILDTTSNVAINRAGIIVVNGGVEMRHKDSPRKNRECRRTGNDCCRFAWLRPSRASVMTAPEYYTADTRRRLRGPR